MLVDNKGTQSARNTVGLTTMAVGLIPARRFLLFFRSRPDCSVPSFHSSRPIDPITSTARMRVYPRYFVARIIPAATSRLEASRTSLSIRLFAELALDRGASHETHQSSARSTALRIICRPFCRRSFAPTNGW